MSFLSPEGERKRRVDKAWQMLGAIVMAVGCFPVAGIFLLVWGFLGFLDYLAAILLYAALLLPSLILTRFGHHRSGWALALVLTALVALGLPFAHNAPIDANTAKLRAGDLGGPITIPRKAVVALVYTPFCHRECIDILLRDGADSVLIRDGADYETDMPRTLMRLRLSPSAGRTCPKLTTSVVATPLIQPDDMAALSKAGQCIVRDTAPLATADVIVRFKMIGKAEDSLSLPHTKLEIWERRPDGLHLLLRQTQVRTNRMTYPAIPVMRFGPFSQPLHWQTEWVQVGPELDDNRERWFRPQR